MKKKIDFIFNNVNRDADESLSMLIRLNDGVIKRNNDDEDDLSNILVVSLSKLLKKHSSILNNFLNVPNNYKFVNEYFEYKGNHFIDSYWFLLNKGVNNLVDSNPSDISSPLIKESFKKIIDLIDFNDLVDWIKKNKINELQYLPHLPDTYVPEPNKTREQTFTKNDYIELIAFSMLMKIILPLIGEYVLMFSNTYGERVNYYLYNVFMNTYIKDLYITKKLIANTELLYKFSNDDKLKNVIKNNITEESYIKTALIDVCITRLSIAAIYNDSVDKNLINLLYNKIKGFYSKQNNSTSKTIRAKRTRFDPTTMSEEPAMETYRRQSELPLGYLVEFSVYIKYVRPEKLGIEMTDKLKEMYNDIYEAAIKHQENYVVMDITIIFISYVLRKLISPQACQYLMSKEALAHAIATSYIWLYVNDLQYIGNLLLVSDTYSPGINVTSKRHTISKEQIEELMNLTYYRRKVKNNRKRKDDVTEFKNSDVYLQINALAARLLSSRLKFNLPEKYRENVYFTPGIDLKKQLADFFIKILKYN